MLNEWVIFNKIRHIMKSVDHPLMVEAFSKFWKGFQDLKIKPSQLNQSFTAQDYLREILPQIKKQAESCLYYGYNPIKGQNKNKEIISNNSTYLLQIISTIE